MTSPPTLGERLRAKREKLGLSREDLCKQGLGSVPAIRQWELGLAPPSPEKAAKIEAWLKNGRAGK